VRHTLPLWTSLFFFFSFSFPSLLSHSPSHSCSWFSLTLSHSTARIHIRLSISFFIISHLLLPSSFLPPDLTLFHIQSMEPTTLWHSVPGRLQSVAVANKSIIWGVTLDQQLCKLNPDTKKWQLVSITTESVNRSRFSSSSAGSALSTSASSTLSPATKKFASILPSLGLSSLNSNTATRTPNLDTGADDEDCESTMLASAATDGTVVRLDGSFKAWYLIAPHDHADYEKDVIWIDLGHYWKCVRQVQRKSGLCFVRGYSNLAD